MLIVRPERFEDIPLVRYINERAFEQPAEADLVDRLRQSCDEVLSLVAEDENRIVGHILFTPVVIESKDRLTRGMGLGPMAVQPGRQHEGIGSNLVRQGLKLLEDRFCPFVVVLGYPEYYPRFGFELASIHSITSQWEGVPDEAFMIHIFDSTALEGIVGITKYRAEFSQVV